jgi:hypothetical protein
MQIIGNLLLKRMLRAIPEAIRTSKDFINFDRCLREEDEALVIQWEAELSAWMQDKSLPDPYHIPASRECKQLYISIIPGY